MTQITVQKIKRYRINSSLPNPEIFLEGDENEKGINIKITLNFSKYTKQKLNGNSYVKIYPRTKYGGIALEPIELGTVDKLEINQTGYFLIDQKKDNLTFKLKVTNTNHYVEGETADLNFKKFEGKNDEKSLVDDDEDDASNSIFPIQEVEDLTIPFKVDMEPRVGSPPTLYVMKGLKNKIKNDASIQFIIITAATREVIKNFIINSDFENTRFKDKWELFIGNLTGNTDYKFPKRTDAVERSGNIKDNINDDIEEIISFLGSKKFKGSDMLLLSAFKDTLFFKDIDEDDDEYTKI